MRKRPVAKLALEDGTVFTGRAFGSSSTSEGEVVFNTSMTGYQEILTDPSYKGQIVTMTYPLIGNYGINALDVESRCPHVAGFIIRELSPVRSNYRADMDLDQYLKHHNIIGIDGIDTRALTRRLRISGAMRGILSTEVLDDAQLVNRARSAAAMLGADWVKAVKPDSAYNWDQTTGDWLLGKCEHADGRHVVAIDCGAKHNILRNLSERGVRVTVLPPDITGEDILRHKPDGLFISNGPGDPAALDYAVRPIAAVIGKVPIFGICLGHQLLGLRPRRLHIQAEIRPPRRQPAGQEPRHRPRRDHQPEPRLRRRAEITGIAWRDRHAHQPQRQHGRGLPPQIVAALLRPIPPRSLPRPARRGLPLRRLHGNDEDRPAAHGRKAEGTAVDAGLR